MEDGAMRDLLLQCSGLAAIAVAILHGVLGATRVFARATIEPPRLRSLVLLCWQGLDIRTSISLQSGVAAGAFLGEIHFGDGNQNLGAGLEIGRFEHGLL